MLRVDFYIVGSPGPDSPQRFACRLAEKAWQSGHRVLIRAESEFDAQRIDELLWTYRPDSFVPHGLCSNPLDKELPVLIGNGAEPQGELDVLINLGHSVPLYYDRCSRVAEIVGNTDEAREAGRERYRYYRDRNCSLNSHDV